MSKILVTGGAGYIGSHTVRLLLEKGYEVVILDSLIRGHQQAIPGDVPFYRGDIRDSELVEKIFTEHSIDKVIHFSAFIEAGESMQDPLIFFDNNVAASVSLFQTMKKFDVSKIVFSSTAAVYGEPQFVPITEEHPLEPINYYGASKLMIEKVLESCEYSYGWKSIRLRYFNAAGAGDDCGENHQPETHLIPLILQVPMGKRDSISLYGDDYDTKDGSCIRDYIHVLDLAQAHIDALEALDNGLSGSFNVGTNTGNSVKEIISLCEEISGSKIPVNIEARRPGDPAILVADNSLIKEKLGWEPKYDLRDIIGSAWKWHASHPGGYEE